MSLAPPPLPTRFPCWCRAVYSWGGESKRDLGFMEGELIECLNAGDGSWWTGRLFRDRRTVGVFPSNFVQVLPDDFRPTSRSVSPLPNNTTKDTPPKPKTFRKPFQAYTKAPHYTTAKQPETFLPSPARSREGSANSVSQAPRQRIQRAASPAPPTQEYDTHRAPSPAPPQRTYDAYRAPSPAPPQKTYDAYRAPSPAPPTHSYSGRGASPIPPLQAYPARAVSPAPPSHSYSSRAVSPAPPAHNYPSRAVSPAPPPHNYSSRAVSPAPSFNPYQHQSQGSQSFVRGDSPPPPAPPPHRHVARHGSTASFNPPHPNTPRQGSNASFDRRYQPSPALGRHDSNASYEPYNPHVSRHGSAASYDLQQAPPHLARHGSTTSYDSGQPPPRGFHASHRGELQLHTPRAASPLPASPSGSHMTPSPLREAMDGVMEQLDALGMSTGTEASDPPLDPWSPECFDMVSRKSQKRSQAPRPHTMVGYPHADEGYETWSGGSSQDPSYQNGHGERDHPLPELTNYVDRMEKQLRMLHGQSSSSTAQEDEPPRPPPNECGP
ncbi:uncharacterized protein DNG_03383 [Cephalotrichum gorgonifer]|uniref:SH3 domain-containing protein n=1 Tax=Cephalotrichum gorgonifer TaxID=2041049 RepID=A0AAE8MUR3_9PEZI|nr:uncharacterized protein DNG_03383 [Cephalotrichum gorgonifer]